MYINFSMAVSCTGITALQTREYGNAGYSGFNFMAEAPQSKPPGCGRGCGFIHISAFWVSDDHVWRSRGSSTSRRLFIFTQQ
jgi:hypothetical protein